ncbi:hypothetical protein HW555_000667 [Spodoptera exigua]|uniref:Uncharacterized protein n=1 Tax=Spodoptera exigua TaxID=7107 RepID=A0A835GS75_SPOEX|nr:hypothetical protein HW555_000667 [Spodoptera exigua]
MILIGATDVPVAGNVPLGARFMEASEMIKPLVCIRLWRQSETRTVNTAHYYAVFCFRIFNVRKFK